MPSSRAMLIEPDNDEYMVLALLALVVGGLIVCCLLACVLPDKLAFMLGRTETAPGDSTKSSSEQDEKME